MVYILTHTLEDFNNINTNKGVLSIFDRINKLISRNKTLQKKFEYFLNVKYLDKNIDDNPKLGNEILKILQSNTYIILYGLKPKIFDFNNLCKTKYDMNDDRAKNIDSIVKIINDVMSLKINKIKQKNNYLLLVQKNTCIKKDCTDSNIEEFVTDQFNKDYTRPGLNTYYTTYFKHSGKINRLDIKLEFEKIRGKNGNNADTYIEIVKNDNHANTYFTTLLTHIKKIIENNKDENKKTKIIDTIQKYKYVILMVFTQFINGIVLNDLHTLFEDKYSVNSCTTLNNKIIYMINLDKMTIELLIYYRYVPDEVFIKKEGTCTDIEEFYIPYKIIIYLDDDDETLSNSSSNSSVQVKDNTVNPINKFNRSMLKLTDKALKNNKAVLLNITNNDENKKVIEAKNIELSDKRKQFEEIRKNFINYNSEVFEMFDNPDNISDAFLENPKDQIGTGYSRKLNNLKKTKRNKKYINKKKLKENKITKKTHKRHNK